MWCWGVKNILVSGDDGWCILCVTVETIFLLTLSVRTYLALSTWVSGPRDQTDQSQLSIVTADQWEAGTGDIWVTMTLETLMMIRPGQAECPAELSRDEMIILIAMSSILTLSLTHHLSDHHQDNSDTSHLTANDGTDTTTHTWPWETLVLLRLLNTWTVNT